MEYRFNQFRRTQLSSYLTPLKYTLNDIKVVSSLSEGTSFIDKAIDLDNDNILEALTRDNKQRSYYIRFKIKKIDTDQKINVRLINTNKEKDNLQTIKSIEVEAGDTALDEYSSFEIIISPNDNHSYNQIYFELSREMIDYNTLNEDGSYGRKINILIERIDEIYNVIDFLAPSLEGETTLKQIGVQTVPGLMMCINGEEIRVGRSGLYEINNGVKVSFIGFIIEDNEKYFILDYQY